MQRWKTSQHEGKRIFEVTFESGQPSSTNSSIHGSVIRAEGHLHGLDSLEAPLFLGSWNKFSFSRADGKNARLRRVDDSCEVVDPEHAKVRDCESTALRPKLLECKQLRNDWVLLTWYSEGVSLPSRAFFASAFVSAEMVAKPLEPASLIIGVIRPEGVATATEMSDFLYL